ncbi:MAG: hypothetical protein JWO54_899 [Candidatus Saccharibacteria bacterium]|nr:hypothetical protein [Candidatus Saccharibacteria bacterium]
MFASLEAIVFHVSAKLGFLDVDVGRDAHEERHGYQANRTVQDFGANRRDAPLVILA